MSKRFACGLHQGLRSSSPPVVESTVTEAVHGRKISDTVAVHSEGGFKKQGDFSWLPPWEPRGCWYHFGFGWGIPPKLAGVGTWVPPPERYLKKARRTLLPLQPFERLPISTNKNIIYHIKLREKISEYLPAVIIKTWLVVSYTIPKINPPKKHLKFNIY